MPSHNQMLGRVNGFTLLKFLGKGTFGAVYQARREEDGRTYAIKKVDTRRMGSKERAEAVNEIRVLASVAGPHVITFYEAFVEADILYIITEYATHGDLFNYLKGARRRGQLAESTIWSLFIQMCLGVRTLHDKNILHRDLKAANVFMCSSSYLKLGDFGVSKVLKSSEALARTQVGTPYYVSPEVWRNKPYNSKCDMWSLGCLLYELCTYRPPFEAESMEGLARKIMRGKYEPIPAGYSRALHLCVSRLLVVDPARRASVHEVLCSDEVVKRMSELPTHPGPHDSPGVQMVDLVQTIQVPRRFNDLTKNLPPSRYDTPLVTPSAPSIVGPRGGVSASNPGAGRRAEPDTSALNPVTEGGAEEESRWKKTEEGARARVKANAPAPPSKPSSAASQQQGGGGLPRLTPQQQHELQQRQIAQRRQAQAQAMQQQQRERQRLGSGQAGGGVKLPHVPGAQPPPTPERSRQIRVVYHSPYAYKQQQDGSNVSIFRSGQPSGGSSYYNPITHQHMSRYYQPGSFYHQRHQPQPQQSRLSHLHSGASHAYAGGAPRRIGGRY